MPNLKKTAAVCLAALLAYGTSAHAQSLESLFDDAPESPAAKSAGKQDKQKGSGLKGFVQFEMARTLDNPTHWSKLRTRGEIGSQGKISNSIKWKASMRMDYDAVFDINDHYPDAVRRDQQATARLHETYLDISAGNWDFRLGRQHVVWGEMVGLFFADVVSARDLREFILPEFDAQRIPQWAARAEYFIDDFHAELLWIPVASYDEIGKPGAEFYPYQPVPPGTTAQYRDQVRPGRSLNHGNYGLRLNWLKNGWDFSGFLYRSMDVQPTFYRQMAGSTITFEPRHGRISQLGGTLSKDFDAIVLKTEAVYTHGRRFGTLNFLDSDGVVTQNTLDWAAGLDFTFPADVRFNAQLFQRAFFDHDAGIIPESRENGYSLYVSKQLGKWEAQTTFISSFNRTDWLFRPQVQWNVDRNWRLLAGVDIFKGPPLGLFGQYNQRDRAYTEVRYSF